MTNSYISNCKNHWLIDPNCPVFSIQYILENAEPDEKERQMMLKKVFEKPNQSSFFY